MPKRVYEEIPENERPSFPTKQAAWEWQQQNEARADRGPARRVAEVVLDTAADLIVDGVKAVRDATRKQQ